LGRQGFFHAASPLAGARAHKKNPNWFEDGAKGDHDFFSELLFVGVYKAIITVAFVEGKG
jgi:hypothetical protein